MRKRKLSALSLFIILFLLGGFSVPSKVVASSDYTKSMKEIAIEWAKVEPKHKGSPYEITPQAYAPYSEGKLKKSYLEDAVNTANFARYLVGLPNDLELDPVLNKSAQYGSVLLNASEFSHYPAKPADMAETFYQLGKEATSSSNIAYGYSTLASSIKDGYLEDGDSSNIDRIGHRRWILNPSLKRVGFGQSGGYSAMKVFDRSREEPVPYSFISYPGKGYFPIDFFTAYYPWHISLNPEKYSNLVDEEVSVSLKRKNDGKTWIFNINSQDGYFHIDHGGYGINNAIIFRPEGDFSINAGDKFVVTVMGIKDIYGQYSTVSFETSFFYLEDVEPEFQDVPFDFWAYSEISYIQNLGIISGYQDGSFKPNGYITQAQASKMIVSALKLSLDDRPDPKLPGLSSSHWSYEYVAALVEEGIISKDTDFLPNAHLTRENMAHMIVNAYKLEGKASNDFQDVSSDYWAYPYISALAANKITTGKTDGTFGPMDPVSRAQFSVFITRAMKLK